MIISGLEIKKRIGKNIWIDPYDESCINPNSYNLKLSNKLLRYTDFPLDMKKDNPFEEIVIPESGYLIEPGSLYLGRTHERTRTEGLIPMLEGRSSIGRLGLFVHVTAGFGDVGFDGFWTLEISAIHPIVVYPWVEICQLYFHTIDGEYETYKSGKYQKNDDVQPSLLFKDFEK